MKGFPEAIEAVFPQAAVQTCIVHLIRNSLDFVSWKDRKPVIAELHKIYRAADGEAGRKALEAFEDGHGPQIRGDRPDLAAPMGADHPVLRLRSGRAQNRLHHG